MSFVRRERGSKIEYTKLGYRETNQNRIFDLHYMLANIRLRRLEISLIKQYIISLRNFIKTGWEGDYPVTLAFEMKVQS